RRHCGLRPGSRNSLASPFVLLLVRPGRRALYKCPAPDFRPGSTNTKAQEECLRLRHREPSGDYCLRSSLTSSNSASTTSSLPAAPAASCGCSAPPAPWLGAYRRSASLPERSASTWVFCSIAALSSPLIASSRSAMAASTSFLSLSDNLSPSSFIDLWVSCI